MEQETQTCTRCHRTREIFSFQTTSGKLRKTCNDCRNYSSASMARKRVANLGSIPEFEKSELKRIIRSMISENNNDEFFENNNQGIQLKCTLKMEEFEGVRGVGKNIATFIQHCDGYSYK
jgi:hypothetical protein